MTDRTIVITGASDGIGAAAARALAASGERVVIVGRSPQKTEAIAAELGADHLIADFGRLAEVRTLAAELLQRYPRIDVLANNAGGLVPRRSLTADGHERTLQSNHLAPFLLTNLLLPRLANSGARIVSTSSVLNRIGAPRLRDLDSPRRPWAGGWGAYGTSKLWTILFTEELARRTTGTGITAYSFHPGFVATGFGRGSPLMAFVALSSGGDYGISAAAGAVPLIELSAAPDPGAPSGTYFDTLTANGRRHRASGDADLARRLWERSAQLVGLPPS